MDKSENWEIALQKPVYYQQNISENIQTKQLQGAILTSNINDMARF